MPIILIKTEVVHPTTDRAWVRGVARLTRLPVTEKTEGSNPFGPAIKELFMSNGSFILPLLPMV